MQKRVRSGRRRLTRTDLYIGIFVLLLCSAPFAIKTYNLFDVLASAISSLNASTTTVFFVPYGDETMLPGGTTSIDININTKIPINALGATISYPKDTLDIIGISKEKSFFDLWTEDTTIAESSGEIRFSGGTTALGGKIGTGTLLTLMVRAKNAGQAELSFKNIEVYPSNDTGREVDTQTRNITFTVQGVRVKTTVGGTGASGSVAAITPNPDLNGDGKINLIDLSILTFKILSGYNPRYDLNTNGSVGLDDLSILLTKM